MRSEAQSCKESERRLITRSPDGLGIRMRTAPTAYGSGKFSHEVESDKSGVRESGCNRQDRLDSLGERGKNNKRCERRSTRLSRPVLPEVTAVQLLPQRTFAFLCGAWQVRCQCPGTVLNHVFVPFGILQFLDFLPGALLRSFAMRQNLQITAKKLQIKNPQKTR